MTRNLSTIAFQRRLIRTAMASPRGEAMNLLGIVYRNLAEMIQDRLPFDTDIDRTMDGIIECYQLLETAVARKFTSLYVENLPENYENALDIIYAKSDPTKEEEDEIRQKYISILADNPELAGDVVYGKFVDSIYLSLVAKGTPLLNESDALSYIYHATTVVRSDGVRLRRSIRNAMSGIEGANQVSGALVKAQNGNRLRNVAVRFRLNSGNDKATDRLHREYASNANLIDASKPNCTVSAASNFVYTIYFDNPIMLHFDKVASMILGVYQPRPNFPAIKYLPDPEWLQQLRCIVDGTSASDANPICAFPAYGERPDDLIGVRYARGPYQDDYVISMLCDAMNIDMDKLRACKTLDDISAMVHNYCEVSVFNHPEQCYLTLYRTDLVENLANSMNLKFIFFMATMLGHKCRIVLECRAHRDEVNNVKLYQMLVDLSVNISAGICREVARSLEAFRSRSRFFVNDWHKVHAKVWRFELKPHGYVAPDMQGKVVELLSTGNFNTASQTAFVDSYVLLTSTTGGVTKAMWNMFDNKVTTDTEVPIVTMPEQLSLSNGFFFKKGEIRVKLLNEINARQQLAHMQRLNKDETAPKPCIFIKVNHITDARIIQALCDAADAGVEVFVTARTSCTIPTNINIPNLHVNSICGKYLEHDRWFIFGELHEDKGFVLKKAFMSSADLMPRNLSNRMEFMYQLPAMRSSTEIASRIVKYCMAPSAPDSGFFNYQITP